MTVVVSMLLGVLGVAARWWITQSWAGSVLPWGTLIVNATGSFCMGMLYAWHLQRPEQAPSWLIPALMIGFFGALTTYSSFALDTLKLVQAQMWGWAALNIFLNNGLSIILCFLGYRAVRLLTFVS